MDLFEIVRMLAPSLQFGVSMKSVVKTVDGSVDVAFDVRAGGGTTNTRVTGKVLSYNLDVEIVSRVDGVDVSLDQTSADQLKAEIATCPDTFMGLYSTMPKASQDAMDAIIKALATGRASWVADGKPHTVFVVPNVAP